VKNILKKTLIILSVAILIVASVFVSGIFWPLEIPVPNMRPGQLVLKNVTLVDVEMGVLRERQDILIKDGRIISVGTEVSDEEGLVLDANGKFAIPGMFDMHAHSFKMSPVLTHPLFIAAGVTAVRDMGGCLGVDDPWVACAEDKRTWDKAVQDGRLIGPRFDQITSLAIDGGLAIPGSIDRRLGAPTAEGARLRVALDKARGIDFLKTYTMLPRDSFFALADEAANNDMYLAGHLPLAVSAQEAIAAGQRSFEHAFLFIWECYPEMAEIRALGDPRAAYTNETRARTIEGHDAALCSDLHEKMIAANTAYVPTHTTRKLDAYARDTQFKNDVRLKYIPSPLRKLWLSDAENMAARAGAGGEESYKAFYEFGIRQTGIAHRAGVTILAGTDAPDSFVFAGSSIRDELAHFTQAGLSPLDALRTATLDSARFLGLEGKAGVLKAGARADIVLLNKNPLDDIQAVGAIDTVILAGTVYDRGDLDTMLAGVEEAANSWAIWPKFAWQLLRSPIMQVQFAD